MVLSFDYADGLKAKDGAIWKDLPSRESDHEVRLGRCED
jgi:hypothetical protein